MVNSLRAVARFCQNKIGWNRIGLALSLTIIAVAMVVLFRMLHDIDVDEVFAALKATEWRHIAAAAAFRRRRLFHADLLRLVRAAHDRARRSSLSHRRACRLHQLFDRPQYRRHRVHRRRGALPHLFGLRAQRRRRGEDLFRRRPDVLARQRHRARSRHRLSRRRRRARSISCRLWSTASSRSRSWRCWHPISPGSGARRARSAAANGR